MAMVAATLACTLSAQPAFRFAEATIDDLQAQMASGALTSHELTAAYLARIAEIDKAGPRLNAVIELNPDALAIADQLDAERKSGHVRGPLHGLPILIKDNIATADEMQTTAGSLALVGDKPPRDAGLVIRLRAAGAVILGKTNLSEWANFRGLRSIGGWSGRGGQTHNPYVLDRSPAGSSSGSAAAVSANLCVAAVGTETSGSVVAPSSVCGVVGFKPTLGLISRSGVIPIAASYDTAGPITRTVRDAQIMLAALSGPDERDVATQKLPPNWLSGFIRPIPADALRGARIGIIRDANPRPESTALLGAAIKSLSAAGAVPVEIGPFPTNPREAASEVMLYELKAGINAYLATLGPASPMKTLGDLIKFNEEHWAQEMPLFGQQHFTDAEARGALTDEAYLAARAKAWASARGNGIDRLMNDHQLDALLALTNGPAGLISPPPSGDPVFGSKGFGSAAGPAAAAGYPSVTVPAGEVKGLPVGVLIYGRPWTEAKLIAYAADFEAKTRARTPPQYLPTLSPQTSTP
jgi:amidase